MKILDLVIFFFSNTDRDQNNYQFMAPAIVNIAWHDNLLNITVFSDIGKTMSKSSCNRATSIEDALNGNKWATLEEVTGWVGKTPTNELLSNIYLQSRNTSPEPVEVKAGSGEVTEAKEERPEFDNSEE